MADAPALLETGFLERRRRVLRASLALFASAGIGLCVLFLARWAAPDRFESVIPPVVLTWAAFGFALWRALRRHWRCPSCEARWDHGDVLASAHWNHCAHCGLQLRTAPDIRPEERIAASELELSGISPEALAARFSRRRRIGAAVAGGLLCAGIAAMIWVQSQELGEWVEHGIVGLWLGSLTAVTLVSTRCPRCRRGSVSGKRRHCQRCGLSLGPAGPVGSSGPPDAPAGEARSAVSPTRSRSS